MRAEQGGAPVAIATYEAASLYWKSNDAGACQVHYRPAGESEWREALAPVYDAKDAEYRGSLVGLSPDQAYEVRLSAGGRTVETTFRTRSDQFPIGRVTILPAGELSDPIVIRESGTADAYHLVTVADGTRTTINVANSVPNGIEIDADYVIVRGIEVRNAAQNGILIHENRHDVVVEQCRVWHWGRMGGAASFGNNGGNKDSGILAVRGNRNLTFQRNLIEYPRGASNDWSTGHPYGPQGITLAHSLGGHVIRYNEIWSNDAHGFNDGIGGGPNFSDTGNMNRDSDIYGNIIRNVWDDAIECEGGNMNVRIWGNFIDKYVIGVAMAATAKGPLYVYRNVFAESRRWFDDPAGNATFKAQERDGVGGGPIFIFHNTILQPRGAMNVFNNISRNTVTRNNIFDVPGAFFGPHQADPSGDFDYDLFNGIHTSGVKEPNGYRRIFPAYVDSYRHEYYPASTTIGAGGQHRMMMRINGEDRLITNPVVQKKNPAVDGGVRLPGFNDDFVGAAPDLGAFELGAPPVEFGRRAYLRYDQGWAPWERY